MCNQSWWCFGHAMPVCRFKTNIETLNVMQGSHSHLKTQENSIDTLDGQMGLASAHPWIRHCSVWH